MLHQLQLHDLRHTRTSLLLSIGTELPVVSKRLGHANPAITGAIYSHQIRGRQKQASDAFAKALEKNA
jgi:integrase